MEYTLEALEPLRVIGLRQSFTDSTAFAEIPKFWDAFSRTYMAGGYPPNVQKAIEQYHVGELGVCVNAAMGRFDYLIAGFCPAGEAPAGMEIRTLPAHTWAKFPCVGPIPDTLQALNRAIFQTWLPDNPTYALAEGMNIEWYAAGDPKSDRYESGIWIPVRPR